MNFDFFEADCFNQPRKHEMKEARNYHLFRVINFSCFRGYMVNNEAKEKAIQDCTRTAFGYQVLIADMAN